MLIFYSLIVPYFLRPDHAHCIVTFFLALAILDNAFEGITTPANLLKLRNHTPCDMPIELKQSMIAIPILRRLSGRGSSQLSTYLPSSSTSMTDQAQRWVFLAGFFQRFTFYFCRRAVNNALTDGKYLIPIFKLVLIKTRKCSRLSTRPAYGP